MTFDSDAPQSKRFAFYGVDDVKTGEAVMRELATLMGGKGKVAILAGNQNAPNLRKRVDGREAGGGEAPRHHDRRHLLSHRDAAGRRRRSDRRCRQSRCRVFHRLLLDPRDTVAKIRCVLVAGENRHLPFAVHQRRQLSHDTFAGLISSTP